MKSNIFGQRGYDPVDQHVPKLLLLKTFLSGIPLFHLCFFVISDNY